MTCSLHTPVKSRGKDPLSGGTEFENCCQLLPIDILERVVCKKTMFDEMASFEEEEQEKGRKDGFKRGQTQALKDAALFGAKTGFAIAKEVAFCTHYSAAMKRAVLEKNLSADGGDNKFSGRERLLKLLSELQELTASFTMTNNLDQNLEQLLKSMRQKFKLAKALYNSSSTGTTVQTSSIHKDLSF